MTRSRDSGYLAAADILRVISIGLVGWYHIWQQSWLDPGFYIGSHYVNLQQFVRNGYLMVDILLVLSGFLLTLPYARATLSDAPATGFREFYVKRFWRIVPSYLLAIALVLLFGALPWGEYESVRFLVKDLLAHLTFTHNLFSDTYFFTPLPGVLWTLGVEVQFYLLFPFIVRLFRKHPWLTGLSLTLIAFCFRAWVYSHDNSVFWVNQLPCMLDLFACGMMAAWLYTKLSARNFTTAARWGMAAAAFLALCIIFQILYRQTLGDGDVVRRSQLVLRFPLGLSAGILLVCGSLQPRGLSRVLGNPVLRFLSSISYNFYIWHQVIALRLKELHIPAYVSAQPNIAGERLWQTRYTWLCFLTAAAFATAITFLLERPVYRRATKRMKNRPR